MMWAEHKLFDSQTTMPQRHNDTICKLSPASVSRIVIYLLADCLLRTSPSDTHSFTFQTLGYMASGPFHYCTWQVVHSTKGTSDQAF